MGDLLGWGRVVEREAGHSCSEPGGLDLAFKNTRDMLRQWELRGYGRQWA